ncbi:hypothetical protein [Lichenicoccus sp.]|uniref:hypothetical protein n=1 Tax=Lichenicoccus sp. TaxID=2781899 RepID=UPI003D12DC16
MRRNNASRASLLAGAALAGAALAHAAPSRADDTGAQISAIEKQIRNLQGELGRMKRSLAKRDADVRAARAEAEAANRQAMSVSQRITNGTGQPLAPQPLSAPPGYMLGPAGPGGIPKYGPYVNVGGVPTPVIYPGPKLNRGQFELLGVRVTLGGFITADSIIRSRNETLDIASNFNNTIPYASSPNYHTPEFRESSRASRVSLLVEADADPVTKLTAYWEADFQGAGSSSNSGESNSYVLRERQLYAQISRNDWDFYVLGGQSYSLLTQNRIGIIPRQENTPLTIDAQFVPGFVWTRNVGIRFVKGFDDDRFDLGLSFESPQASYFTGGNGTGSLDGTVDATNTGSGTLNPDTSYSDDIAPDVILKATADPGLGHYELYGLARFLHDRTSVIGSGDNHTVLAGGGGGDAIVPLVPGKLELTASVLAGEGIGRYGSAQLPDATFSRTGAPQPLPEIIALAGLVAHPASRFDLYAYVGTEQITHRESYTEGKKGYGYGSPLYSNVGCDTEQPITSPLAQPCTANTSGVVQGTLGAWWRFLRGDYGTMQTGIQYSYTRKTAFEGVGGSPSTDDNMIFLSFRYLPFQ